MKEKYAWHGYQSLLSKFYGVVDDYEALKSKWQFLLYELNPATPNISETFEKLDTLVDRAQRIFDPDGLKDRILVETNLRNRELNYSELRTARRNFENLNMYVAKLRTAFVQRSSCLEVLQVPFGTVLNPERTIGKELFYVAVDTISKVYSDCLDLGEIKWDGLITFAPPIKGTVLSVFDLDVLKLFNVCFSDELKYFFGTVYLAAHEFSHIPMMHRPMLLEQVFDSAIESQEKEWKGNVTPLKRCELCPLNPTNKDKSSLNNIFKEVLIDVLAFKIAGGNYVHAVLDLGLWPGLETKTFPRMEGLINYLYQKDKNMRFLDEYFSRLNSYTVKMKQHSNILVQCIACMSVTGAAWGKTIYELETKLSVFSGIVRKEFEIAESEERDLKKRLADGSVACDVDPRKILHAHYELVKSGDFSNFYSLYYSLAYNTANL